jgi:hypothetical protein
MGMKKRFVFTISCMVVFTVFIIQSVYSASTETKTLTTKELYELKERCGKTCAQRFKQEYGKEGIYSDKDNKGGRGYSSHYNAKLNKCFILIEDTSFSPAASRNKMLWDVNENKEYGGYYAFRKDTKSLYDTIAQCEVLRKPCKSEQEWDSLVKPFMEE